MAHVFTWTPISHSVLHGSLMVRNDPDSIGVESGSFIALIRSALNSCSCGAFDTYIRYIYIYGHINMVLNVCVSVRAYYVGVDMTERWHTNDSVSTNTVAKNGGEQREGSRGRAAEGGDREGRRESEVWAGEGKGKEEKGGEGGRIGSVHPHWDF